MAERSTVGPKGQITIPKDLRERYHLLEGEDVIVLPADEGVLVKHLPNSLRGRLKGKVSTGSIEKEIDAVRKEWRL